MILFFSLSLSLFLALRQKKMVRGVAAGTTQRVERGGHPTRAGTPVGFASKAEGLHHVVVDI